ncbi:MAG: CaiB/BaiF CoA transferase family protein [Woeseiaceae bacterium]
MAATDSNRSGPLAGIRVIELAGIGPGPFCAMLLSDMGAEVISVERPGSSTATKKADVVCWRGRKSIVVDVKQAEGVKVVLDLVRDADVLMEGFRPGVVERLGLGPDVCHEVNPGLVYGRMTGWGQDGPLAQVAGHDINYISLSGALHGIGRAGDVPVPPLNLVGDYGGGGMLLAFGIVSALVDKNRSGKGQVIDASMLEGSALLSSVFYGMRAQGLCGVQPGENALGTAAPFYEVYETRTGPGKERQYVSIGPLEPQFYNLLLSLAGLPEEDFHPQQDETAWPRRKEKLRELFLTKTRDEWCDVFAGSDACFAPVLSIDEAPAHPHNLARGSFVEIDGITQPAPSPKFSRTSPSVPRPARTPGQDTKVLLAELGYTPSDVERLKESGVVNFS